MTDSTCDLADEPQRGLVSRIATSIFVGIPMTFGLVVALGFYCTYEFAKHAVSKKRQQPADTITNSTSTSEQTFTASLTKFAQIHAGTVKIEVPKSTTDAIEEASARSNK